MASTGLIKAGQASGLGLLRVRAAEHLSKYRIEQSHGGLLK
ncbi:hypothetical protein H4CHR_06082 [Variovorax sp. PBS-H4]|nr:hypothetical protein [Variovorax sp. PBS-H4]VTU41347.1 hypothetical protein H4CHR_06082 [Variovorax sp. PBS-H4]